MKLIPCNPAKGKAFSGMTDDELARHIEYEFPDLLGSLRLLLDRFQKRCLVLKIALMKKSRLTRNRSFPAQAAEPNSKLRGKNGN